MLSPKRLVQHCLIAIALLIAADAFALGSPQADRRASIDGLLIELSSEAEEAINAGVSLSLRLEFAVLREYWFFSRQLQAREHRYVISRQSLSDRYVVKRDDLPTPHIFRSVQGAINYIAAQALILLEFYSDDDNPYAMRLSLNKFDLPAPMRLQAFISDAWSLDTGWIQWRSEN